MAWWISLTLAAVYTGDDVAAVVVDVGSTMVKAGFAGEDTPKATFPTWVGVVERNVAEDASDGKSKVRTQSGDAAAVAAEASRAYYVGANSFAKYRDGLEIRSPTHNGVSTCVDERTSRGSRRSPRAQFATLILSSGCGITVCAIACASTRPSTRCCTQRRRTATRPRGSG